MALVKMNFLSQSLGMQTNVTICIPSFSFADLMQGKEDYYVPGMKFQVLWLLHGGSGDDSDYTAFSNIVRFADVNKIAVVMPCDYNAMYTDDPDGVQYMSYITEELPKLCRSFYPLSDKREDNFIAGLSMGAMGTMAISSKFPENYAAALVMSGGMRDPNAPAAATRIRSGALRFPKINPEGAVDVAACLKENVASGKQLPKYFLTCGGDDFALGGTKYARDFLTENGYDVFYEEVPGYGHEWDFWDLTLRKALGEWLPIKHAVIYPE